MHLKICLAALVASSSLAIAVPPAVKPISPLRLIKTSPTDKSTWVTEEDKNFKYRAKKIDFVDINRYQETRKANALIAKPNINGPKSWLTTLTNYSNRYYRSTYGTQSATGLFNLVKSVAASNAAITVSQFTHSYNQSSIIARILGISPNLIVVGVYFDFTGGTFIACGPGADDNGFGVVVILEALRVLADNAYRPKNILEFHFYSGEEGGLLENVDVWRNYKAVAKNVLAFMNIDMTGYSSSGKISIYDDYVDTGLLAYVRIVTGYVRAYTTDTCGYECSDHASWYSNGFPSAYVCDEPDATSSPYIHSPQDTYATVDFVTVQRHIKFTVALLVETSYL